MATHLCMIVLYSWVSVVRAQTQFEYEYRVLEKLVDLDINQTNLLDRLKHLEQQINNITLRDEDIFTDIRNLRNSIGGGSVYVRWGRTMCPSNGTDKVYDGYAAGSHYSYTGGAVDYLCLPKDPQWDIYNDAQNDNGVIYGAEYESVNQIDSSVKNHDVPCSVCRSTRPSMMMLPGKTDCPGGWTREYSGYLTSGYTGHAAASQYVCLDGKPETLEGGSPDQNGVLFYLVEARCGSLPCPPYVNGRELTCAVCTKGRESDAKERKASILIGKEKEDPL